jgi:uncharacterized repeat protein (TIGR02543 family)
MMNIKTLIFKTGIVKHLLLVMSIFLFSTVLFACTNNNQPTLPSILRIEVTKLPAKLDYLKDETVDFNDGELTATFDDNSTKVVKFTDDGVSISEVDTSTIGRLTVTVRYLGKGVRFYVNVTEETFVFTFDYNYISAELSTSDIIKGNKVTRPADPIRENYVFENWYSDVNLTIPFDFNTPITQATTIYAKWLENATYYNFVFNYNQDRLKVNSVTQKVKEDDKAIVLATNPSRVGYRFDGWYTQANGGTPFNFDTPITANTTVYAKWTKTVTGLNAWIFEAEDSNLAGKTGPGLSGTLSGPGMIQYTTEHNASNNRFVGYLYEYGLSLEFNIVSDITVSDAKIEISLSAEIRDFDIDPSSFLMILNNQEINYTKISFKNVPPSTADSEGLNCLNFQYFLVIEGATLNKGMNLFQVVTVNNEATQGTTLTAIAPLVDAIRITTSAVLVWDDFLGLPKKNY